MIGSEVSERVDRSTYLGSLISPCGLVCDEISARIQKARLAFANLRRLLVFDHRCLQNIARISWNYRVSNAVVKKRVLGKDGKSIDEVVKLHRLRWLGHVLRMPNDRLPRRAMFSGIGTSSEQRLECANHFLPHDQSSAASLPNLTFCSSV
ncbi:unnamed protein product [Schistosoma mattheei]|uniref:Uncharacterized protein n=1 Tax=Schistosoma mattheei TaxID=31246 RepID=A0A183PMF3_9TREM|nr:unnamed protein product [Schistosoma mattheei]